MSILKATKSFTRFKMSDIEMNSEMILERLNTYKIKEIKPTEEIIFGWSSLIDTYEPFFDDMSFMTGNYLTVSMRIDQKKIPGALLKKEVHKLQKKVMKEKGFNKLSRSLKLEIREAVRNNILAGMKATPNDFDVVLDFSNNTAYLFNNGKLPREVFEHLMKETFNVQLEMVFPFTMALPYVEQAKLELIQPTNFS